MTPAILSPPTPEPQAPPRRPTRTLGRVATVVIVLALVGFWIWILSGAPKRDNPDRVADRALINTTARRCKEAVDAIDKLPAATDSHTPRARAAVVDQATTILDRLVDRIEADTPTTGDDTIRLRGWTGDWRTYLRDRRSYTQRLRHDPRAKFLLDVNKAHDSVDRAITNFADINDIPSCDAPGDVG